MASAMSLLVKFALLITSFAALARAAHTSDTALPKHSSLTDAVHDAIPDTATATNPNQLDTSHHSDQSDASASDATLPDTEKVTRPVICYIKRQRCCFKFVPCGLAYKKLKVVHPCDFKRCRRVCPLVCRFKFSTVQKKVCNTVKTPVIKCRKIRKYHYGKLVWISKCKKTFASKSVCTKRPVVVKKKVCANKCTRKCVLVRAVCAKIKVLTFRRFCPRVFCGRLKVVRRVKAPVGYVLKKPFEVKVLGRRRIVLNKH